MRKFFTYIFIILVSVSQNAFAMPFQGHQIAMSAANRIAVQNASKIAEAGGNPADIAVSLVLNMAVTNPYFAALGGGGFAVLKMGNDVEVLDFREKAPQATSPSYFSKKNKNASTDGGAAVGIPGIPAGLYALHKKYGKIHWSRLFDDPIHIAQKGFRISGELADTINENKDRFNAAGKNIFFKPDGKSYLAGDILIQKNLASALKEMRNRNITSFYHGMIAKDLVDTIHNNGGDATLKDFVDYAPVWRTPLITSFANHKIYLMPPPSSGGIVLQTALKLTERLDLKKYPLYSVDEFHLLGEILSRSFRGRTMIGDPDHYKVPITQLLSEEKLSALEKSIKLNEATTITAWTEENFEKSQTTHLSVLDSSGHAVAMTVTLNGDFGSGVVSEKYGIALNNEMDDFTTKPGEPNMFGLIQGKGNEVQPGKRPLSSMSPTLVEKDGKIIMSVGAPGGPRIISSVFQVLYRSLYRKQDLEKAVESPRVHHQLLPNKLFIDYERMGFETIEGLKKRKHVVEEGWMGRVYAVQNNNGILSAVADTRGEGATGGQ